MRVEICEENARSAARLQCPCPAIPRRPVFVCGEILVNRVPGPRSATSRIFADFQPLRQSLWVDETDAPLCALSRGRKMSRNVFGHPSSRLRAGKCGTEV
jgi:hypothetical protein